MCHVSWPRQGVSLPPPYDLDPSFPTVFFDLDGMPSLCNVSEFVICHIVPTPDNRFIKSFGAGEFRRWSSPEAVAGIVRGWVIRGLDVVDYPYRANVRVTGVSRGKARFVLGGGIAAFVVQELGEILEGVRVSGRSVGGKIATLGVSLYGIGAGTRLAVHIFPPEFVADPALPGLSDGLSYDALCDVLAPPPLFSRGLTVEGSPSYAYARVHNFVSAREVREGGGGGLGDVLVRGRSYRELMWPTQEECSE